MINRFRDTSIIKQIIIYALILFFIVFGIIKIQDFIFGSSPVNKDYVFISLKDIEDAYEETGDYVEYMIADHNPEYVFSTIETYMTDRINPESNIRCIVSGIYYNKNEDKTIYEVAIVNINNVDDVKYRLIDTDEQKIYDIDSKKPIDSDDKMKEKLDKYEQNVIDLQKHYMTKKNDTYIITRHYLKTLVDNNCDVKTYNYLGLVCNNKKYFYKVDVDYTNGHSDMILINARTGNMYK